MQITEQIISSERRVDTEHTELTPPGICPPCRHVTGSVGVVSRVLPVHLVLRAVAVFIRMDHAVVLEGDGHWTQTGGEQAVIAQNQLAQIT